MDRRIASLALAIVIPLSVRAQDLTPAIESEVRQINSLAADPDLKLAVVGAMAAQLGVHRNHLMLLRRTTGQSYGALYVREMRNRGLGDREVLDRLRALNRNARAHLSIPASGAPRHLVRGFVSTSLDHNAAGTFYSLLPEVGVDLRHVSVVMGVPYYRAYGAVSLNTGIGDVYVTTSARGRASGLDLLPSATIGFPSGDKNKGLGAGRVSADASLTVAKRFETLRPWAGLGFANSVFNQAGYRRPYISDGNAAHFDGGLDFSLRRRISFGMTGFALRAFGDQTVYSVTPGNPPAGQGTMQPPSGGMQPPGGTGGMGPGMTPMPGPGGGTVPANPSMPFYERAQRMVVPPSEVDDHGGSAWFSVTICPGLSFTTSLVRSVPFHLTTVRIGINVEPRSAFRR